MENASKALIIAGGVLVAVLIISILAYMWVNVSSFHETLDDNKMYERVLEFNKQFESYNKQLLRGADVASVINKVIDNNSKIIIRDRNGNIVDYTDDPGLIIHCEVILKNRMNGSLGLGPTSRPYTEESKDIVSMLTNNTYQNDLKEFKRLYFKCTKIDYNNQNGRVNLIRFEQIPSSTIESYFN